MRSDKYIIKQGNCWQICPFQFPEDELKLFQMGVRWEDMDTQVSSGSGLPTLLLLMRVFYRAQSSRERGMLRKWLRSRPISERQTDRGIEGWQKTRAESGPGAEPTRPPVDCSPGAKCTVNGHLQWPGQDDPLCLSLAASLWSPLPLGVDTDQQVIDRHKPWETVLGDLVLILTICLKFFLKPPSSVLNFSGCVYTWVSAPGIVWLKSGG